MNLTTTSTNTTHFLYDGQGGWVEAIACEEDCWDEPGWHFWRVEDFLRWLRS